MLSAIVKRTARGAEHTHLKTVPDPPLQAALGCSTGRCDDPSTSFKARTIPKSCSWQEGSVLRDQYCIREQLGEGGLERLLGACAQLPWQCAPLLRTTCPYTVHTVMSVGLGCVEHGTSSWYLAAATGGTDALPCNV